PDFRRHDSKSTSGIASARSLNTGIQREQVGLERNLVDNTDDPADLLRGLLDFAHGGDRLTHDLAAALGVGFCRGYDLARMGRAFRRLLHRHSDLVEGGSRLLEVCSLLLRPP